MALLCDRVDYSLDVKPENGNISTFRGDIGSEAVQGFGRGRGMLVGR